MGFFSSRRHDIDAIATSPSPQSQGNSPSPGIIRSRFYGRNKNKARDANPTTPSREVATPLAESKKQPSLKGSPRTPNGYHSMSDSGKKGVSNPSLHSPNSQASTSKSPGPANTRASTDAITVVLAQRLTELASANADGLLDDDEYRLLRQNLFERLDNSSVPQDNPPIPTVDPSHPPKTPKRKDSIRTPSVNSKGTVSSTVSGLFRRTTGRRKTSTDTDTLQSDTTSLLSTTSNSPTTFTRRLLRISLSKQSSMVSLRLDTSTSSPTIHDNGSTSHIASPSRPDAPNRPIAPSISRSSTTRSKRNAPPPPSAFHHRTNGIDPKRVHSGLLDDDPDDEALKSSKEIRAQIEAVEAEGRRLMDAFNGLELSTLTRKSQTTTISTLPSAAHLLQGLDPLDNAWSSQTPNDPDGMSMRSTTSNGASLSTHHSPARSPRTVPNTPLVSQPVSLARKSSLSSISSRGRSGTTSGAPYLPALPSSLGRLLSGSTSSVNLVRSTNHLPLAPVAEGDSRESGERDKRYLRLDMSSSALLRPGPASPRRPGTFGDDDDIAALEVEMAEIRRRRAEVMARYEERLGYLRAKLKGAELHEKLLRR